MSHHSNAALLLQTQAGASQGRFNPRYPTNRISEPRQLSEPERHDVESTGRGSGASAREEEDVCGEEEAHPSRGQQLHNSEHHTRQVPDGLPGVGLRGQGGVRVDSG